MSTALKKTELVLNLDELVTESNKDEQAGLKFLNMGATVGIRNPKAHELTIQTYNEMTMI
jgi:hypothetical protein